MTAALLFSCRTTRAALLLAFPCLTSTQTKTLEVYVTLFKVNNCRNDSWNCYSYHYAETSRLQPHDYNLTAVTSEQHSRLASHHSKTLPATPQHANCTDPDHMFIHCCHAPTNLTPTPKHPLRIRVSNTCIMGSWWVYYA